MSEDEQERQYHIVVFGSTGYTGKFVAEELYRVQCEVRRSLRWAAAGRNEKVRASLEGKRRIFPVVGFYGSRWPGLCVV